MILIIGSNHDDVLYFENLIKDPTEEKILRRYHVLKGTIANKEVIILQDVYTSVVSSMLTSYLIDKYHIMCIFVVGRCEALTENLECGDVVVGDSTMFADVDLISKIKGKKLGQIPGYDISFKPSLRLINNMNACLDEILTGKHYNASFVSTSFFRENKEVVDFDANKHVSSISKHVVLDGETGGVAIACFEHDIPYVAVKVVEAKLGEYTSLENYLVCIDRFASTGKAVARCIEQIHRTDFLK